MFYIYRATTDKLADHMNRIAASGDEVVWPVFTGGRDWILVCRPQQPASVGHSCIVMQEAVHEIADSTTTAHRRAGGGQS